MSDLTDDELRGIVLRWRDKRLPGDFEDIWIFARPIVTHCANRYLAARVAQDEDVTWFDLEAFAIRLVLKACDVWQPELRGFRTQLYSDLRNLGRKVLKVTNDRRVARGESRIPETMFYKEDKENANVKNPP